MTWFNPEPISPILIVMTIKKFIQRRKNEILDLSIDD